MAIGTGLPVPKPNQVLAEAPRVIDGDALFNASAWSQIAEVGGRISDQATREIALQEAGAVAGLETSAKEWYVRTADQYHGDPDKFDAAAKTYNNTALGTMDPKMVPHARKYLDNLRISNLNSQLSIKRTKDDARATEALNSRIKMADNDLQGLATAGLLGSTEGQAAAQTYKSVIDTAVSTGAMTQEKADLLFEDGFSRAQGEAAARSAVTTYREKGFDTAVKELEDGILKNQNLSLKTEGRYKVFNRALSAIRLQQAQDKEDRAEFTAVSTDLRARIDTQQAVDPSEIRDTLTALQRTGAAAEFRRLSISAATAEATAPFRSGLNLREFAISVAARRAGTEPDLARLRQIESGGNPNAVSPTGAKGPYQFTSGTAAQYGLTNPFDEAASADAVKRLWKDNAAVLQSRLGRVPTGGEMYLAHQQGAGGAGALLSNPNANVVDALATAYGGDRAKAAQAVTVNGGSVDMTAGQFAQKWVSKYEGASSAPGVPSAGAVTQRVQGEFVKQARGAWPDFKKKIDNGQTLNADDMNAIHFASLLSGDAKWVADVEALATANQIGLQMAGRPAGERQSLMDQAKTQLSDEVTASLQKQYDRQNKMVRDAPVDYAVGLGQRAPDPISFGSSDVARAAIAQRVKLARGVAEQQQVAAGSPLRDADRAAIAGVIATGDPRQTSVALDAISSIPDEMLVPALKSPEIKDAISGATRSSDPARYGAAMSFLDKMWQRAPETAKELFGEDAIHSLMTWQSNSRYMTQEALAAERAKAAADPQVRERQKKNQEEGRMLAREYNADQITKQFDTSWAITPGFVARGLGTQPTAPVDMLTRDALMGDFETQYARRYAETMDKDVALKQTTELMKEKWTASPTNGGRIMVNAPEKYYPAIDGSYDWMKTQLDQQVRDKIGPPQQVSSSGDKQFKKDGVYDYTLVSDRRTASEAQSGQPPSYQVVVKDSQSGRMTVLPERFQFDAGPGVEGRRAGFEAQRRRVLEMVNNPGFNDPMTGFSP